MTIHALVSPDLPAPAGPYSHITEAGGIIWTAGFGPQDPATGAIPDGVDAQTEAVIDNLERALAAAGVTLADVTKTTVHLHDLADFAEFNAAYGRRFSPPHPVRTTVGSTLNGILVEIDAVAVRPA